MRVIRIIAMVMLAFLYFGGTYVQLAGAAFPLVGTGKKAYSEFRGVGKEPIRPTISPRRHLPMVKPISPPPIIAVDKPDFAEPEQIQSLSKPCFLLIPLDFSSPCCNDRAPPLS